MEAPLQPLRCPIAFSLTFYNTWGMSYPKEIRDWWMRVEGNGNAEDAQCIYEYFIDSVLLRCMAEADEVHHGDEPQSIARRNGRTGNESTGMPLCRDHHRGDSDEVIFEALGTFHPEMGAALTAYRNGDKQAFEKAAREYAERADRGERVSAGDWRTDEYFTQIMQEKAMRYILEHPDDPKPQSDAGSNKVMQPKRWYDGLFD